MPANQIEELKDAELMSDLYEDMTQPEIAELFGCSSGTVSYWLREHGVETRPNGSNIPELNDPDWLQEQTNKKTQGEIADDLGCSRSVVSKWMIRHGVNTRESKPINERFWDRVEQGSPKECWEWTGVKAGNGYGMFWDGEETLGAHRYVMKLSGKDPGTLQVNHHCDNRSCVNPFHLYIGTQSENMLDAWERSR